MNQARAKQFLKSYGINNGHQECPVCVSRGVRNNKHRHFSTNYQRQVCSAAGETEIYCPICQDRHAVNLVDCPRVKAIISSSTLNGFWQAEEWTGTEKYHVEVEAVGGLTLLGARRLWKQLYENVPKPVDCHLTVGLNDVIHLSKMKQAEGLTPEEDTQRKVDIFMAKVQAIYEETVAHTARHKLDSPNGFSIGTLLRPPQLYRLDGTTVKYGETQNALLDGINKEIDIFNARVRSEQNKVLGGTGQNPVVTGMENYGIHYRKKKARHFLHWFREEDVKWKLHLKPKYQAKAAKSILHFFKKNTTNVSQYYDDTTPPSEQPTAPPPPPSPTPPPPAPIPPPPSILQTEPQPASTSVITTTTDTPSGATTSSGQTTLGTTTTPGQPATSVPALPPAYRTLEGLKNRRRELQIKNEIKRARDRSAKSATMNNKKRK